MTIDLHDIEDPPETMTIVLPPVADDFPAEKPEDDVDFQTEEPINDCPSEEPRNDLPTDEPEFEEFYDAEDEGEEECDVVGDEDCDVDEVRYADEDADGNRTQVGVEESKCEDFEAVFGNDDAGEDDELLSDDDSVVQWRNH